MVGDPVYDIYDDEGRIQDESNDVEVKDVGSWREEVLLQKILVEVNLELHNSRFGNHGASWAFVKTDPIKATTHHRNKEHMYFNLSFPGILKINRSLVLFYKASATSHWQSLSVTIVSSFLLVI
ncbi:hypothetical protein DY000_02041722 [Brassica cretica]|uniref:Uncharacterized protein n=1 Tax=Brassica cretica TaxID=69181 RepID=A0ABQ7BHY4_BRACR|nr:hypothetical protein DY000_02041722 [Brassica cretica]